MDLFLISKVRFLFKSILIFGCEAKICKGKIDSKIIPLEHCFPRKLLNFALKK